MIQKATMVLEGGATRGVFTSGALDYLMEKDFYVSHVIGVSAGACNAVDYVSHQIGRTRDCMIHKDRKDNYYYGIRDIVKKKSLLNMDKVFVEYPNETYYFDSDMYFSSGMYCELVVTNCLSGGAEYLTENQDRDRLLKICRASSSMPLVSPVVNVDGKPYLDGGLADSIPVRRAEQMENKKIIVILTRNLDYRKSLPSKALIRLYRRSYKKYPNLVRSMITRSMLYNRTMNHLESLERAGKIFVLRPSMSVVSRLERDYEKLMQFYDHGYISMEEEYQRLMQYMKH